MAIEQDFQNTMEQKYYCKYGKLQECSLQHYVRKGNKLYNLCYSHVMGYYIAVKI